MDGFETARRTMVDGQVRTVDVTEHALISALLAVPRERFVAARMRLLAYIDEDIAVAEAGEGRPARYLMEPGPFARLVQLAAVEPGDVVLDIGCATGYSAAVLARLASSVVAVESDATLASAATATLTDLGVDNVAVVTAPLEQGYASEGPYDVIMLEGAVEEVPEQLFVQLKEGGRLVAVVGYGRAAPAIVFTRSGGEIGRRVAFDVDVRPLPGFRKPKAFVF